MTCIAWNILCFLAGALSLHLATALWCWLEDRRKARKRAKLLKP